MSDEGNSPYLSQLDLLRNEVDELRKRIDTAQAEERRRLDERRRTARTTPDRRQIVGGLLERSS
jgi:hypothetical protein